MYYYKAYNLITASSHEIPKLKTVEISKDDAGEIDVVIKIGKVPQEIRDLAYSGYEMGYNNQSYWFRNHIAIFFIKGENHILVELVEGSKVEEALPFIMGYCFTLVFTKRSKPAIHCSGVRYKEKSFIISGYSGSGKSSLATRIIESGGKMVTDDIAIVDTQGADSEAVYIYPSFPAQNLCKDGIERYGYQDKELMAIETDDRDKYVIDRREEFVDQVTKLEAMFILSTYEGDQVEIKEITGINKLKAITENLFISVFLGELKLPDKLMVSVVEMAKRIPVYHVKRPMEGDSTEEQFRKIKERIL